MAPYVEPIPEATIASETFTWEEETLDQYGSIETYLLKEKLHFPKEHTPQPPVILLPNDFPYAVEPGISHLLMWSQTALHKDYVEEILLSRYGKDYEWVFWVNPVEIQSVRRLPHVHIFLRGRLDN
ncbi:hypothetical protein DFQ28_002622 [Apophysomyces sp. BC1034]|nr:hypothetical protein DFQ29_010161 [Apophysomyces sp. BC1021]KAG0190018.1 hypothetical protein DFQ28_002622 [Apophysomyces sp. BC1034]